MEDETLDFWKDRLSSEAFNLHLLSTSMRNATLSKTCHKATLRGNTNERWRASKAEDLLCSTNRRRESA